MPAKKKNAMSRSAANRIGGQALLAQRGLAHYRELAAKAQLAKAAHPKPPRPSLTRLEVFLRDDQVQFLARLVAASGMSKAALLREALDCYWGEWEKAKEEARKHRTLAPFVKGSNVDRGGPEGQDEGQR